MARFLFLKESNTYFNLDHVTAVKLQEQGGKEVAEVLFTGIDTRSRASGAEHSRAPFQHRDFPLQEAAFSNRAMVVITALMTWGGP